MNLCQLEAQLTLLESRISQLKVEGILLDCRLSSAKPGGTASKGAKVQYRKRFTTPQANGKKSEYVQARDVEKVRADIARGREYRKLEKQRQSVIDQIDAIKRRIATLQG
jgi:hypothetical protein